MQVLPAGAAPADDVPMLLEHGVASDGTLPELAERNADGSVTLTFAYPVTLAFRKPGSGQEVSSQLHTALTLRRLTGRDMRQVLAAKGMRATQVALALSAGLSAAKMALLFGRMDASDNTAARAVVSDLMGINDEDGLPAHASEADGQIVLPLTFPAEPDGFDPRHELVFRRLRGDDLIAIAQAKDTLPMALARGTGMTPKEAGAVFDAMDAADIMGVNQVIGFLSGSGRKTGG